MTCWMIPCSVYLYIANLGANVRFCRQACAGRLRGDGEPLQRHGMTTFAQLTLTSSDPPELFTDGCGRQWPLTWPGSRAPPASTPNRTWAATWPGAQGRAWTRSPPRRPHLELYIRWMQEIRWFKPSTVSRRFSVTAGFYRTCVLDGVLEHSPAEHVCCPALKVPMRDALCVPVVRGEKTPPGVAAAGFSSVRCRSLSAWCRWCQSMTSVTAERAAGSSTRFLPEANAATRDCRARLLTARG